MYGFIYETTNLTNGRKYIGKRHYDKWGQWEKYLGSGKILKQAIEKYGAENFSRVILEECETKEIMAERERFYIAERNACADPIYYNIARGGEGGSIPGVPFSAEHKANISKALKGKKRTEEQRAAQSLRQKGKPAPNRRKVICCETEEVYDSATEASRKLNVSKSTVATAIRRNNAVKGFHFKYLDEYNKDDGFVNKKSKEYLSELAKRNKGLKKSWEKLSKKVIDLDTGIEYCSLSECSRETGVPSTTVCKHCKKETGRFRYV